MASRAGRVVLGSAVVLTGVAALVFAGGFRTATVLVEQERKIEDPPPENGFPLPIPGMPSAQGPRTVTVKELVPVERSEPYLQRLAALGGMERLPSGKILEKQTSAACPT